MLAITPNLYISDSCTSQNEFMLRNYKISHVILFDELLAKVPSISDYNFIKLNVRDAPNENLYQYFNTIIEEMKKVIAGQGIILISSAKGVGRNCAVAIAFLMAVHRLSFSHVFEVIQRIHPKMNIVNFAHQLHAFEYDLSKMDCE